MEHFNGPRAAIDAIRFVAHNAWPAARLAGTWVFLLLTVIVAIAWFTGGNRPGAPVERFDWILMDFTFNGLYQLANLGLNVVATTVISVTWIRYSLLGERQSNPFHFSMEMVPYFSWNFRLCFVMITATVLSALSINLFQVREAWQALIPALVITLAIFAATLAIYGRSVLLLSSAALDHGRSIRAATHLTRGYTVTLGLGVFLANFFAFIAILLPLWLILDFLPPDLEWIGIFAATAINTINCLSAILTAGYFAEVHRHLVPGDLNQDVAGTFS